MPRTNRPSQRIRHWLHGLLMAAIVLAVTSGLAYTTRADAPLEGTNPAQWRVVWLEDPATRALIAWSTAAAGGRHEVRYGKRSQEARTTQACQRSDHYSGTTDFFFHHCHLANLDPETEYEFVMISEGVESQVLYFKTAPADEREFAFLYGADSRSDQDARRAMNQMMAGMLAAGAGGEEERDEIFCLAHGGDYIYDGRRLNQWLVWMSDHELTTAEDGRVLPIIPARGNHDEGALFDEVFGFPPGDGNYYAVNIGPLVRFVTLNTNISTAGTQAEWLDDELKASRPNRAWLIAQYHRPAYPAYKSPGLALTSWVPLFEEYNVDLVCEADGHNIKRTVPIRGDEQDPTGVVYVGEGGLGVRQRTPDADRWYLQAPGMTAKGHHVQQITITPRQMTCECVLHGGEVADTYTFDRRDD